MRVISVKKLREFWENADNHGSEPPLRGWLQTVKACDWTCFADVRKTYAAADLVDNKVVFDIGGNKFRLIAVMDYAGHKVFVRYVLTHKDYDTNKWKQDTFGKDWKPRPSQAASVPKPKKGKGPAVGGKKPGRRGRSKK